MWLMCRFLGSDSQSRPLATATSSTLLCWQGKLTRNYAAFVHSKDTQWDPPGMCSPWYGLHSVCFPLHMLPTGSGGYVKWGPHPVGTKRVCYSKILHISDDDARGIWNATWKSTSVLFLFWSPL